MELPARHPDLFSASAETAEAAEAAEVQRPGPVGARSLARSDARASASLPLPWAAVAAPSPPLSPPPTAAPACLQAPETLHPALWRAHQVGRTAHPVCASGFAELDQQLPGGGWPTSALTELLLPHPGVGELRLLAPALVALQDQQRSVMWFNPPAAPCPWALGALGLDMQQQVVVAGQQLPPVQMPAAQRPASQTALTAGPGQARRRQPAAPPPPQQQQQAVADILWALEQALKSGQLGAVLAWLPSRLPADALRRLQLAAQLHEGPVFLLRAAEERSRASVAPLRLLLSAWGPDLLRVAITKRRGPPLAEPLMLELPPVLSAPALARALRGSAQAAPQRDTEGVALAPPSLNPL